MKPQYGILRFAKYKGPEISKIEAHNERTKEQYASNPDIDMTKTHRNFHLVTPERKYRAEADKDTFKRPNNTHKQYVFFVCLSFHFFIPLFT